MSGELRYDRCRVCNARVIWASSAATGARTCLDAEQVVPASVSTAAAHGAYVLIVGQAFTLPDAVAHLGRTHNVDDSEAHGIAVSDFTWHLHHRARCS